LLKKHSSKKEFSEQKNEGGRGGTPCCNAGAMKGINTPGQALDSGGVASFSASRDGVSHLAFPALSRERNLPADSFPLAPLGNETNGMIHQFLHATMHRGETD